MNDNKEKSKTLSVSEKIFDALLEFYAPAENSAGADEMKSTQDLIEEMNQIENDIPLNEINTLMEANGFKLHYTGIGYSWLLKTR